jgi:hypothetical protein
LLGFFGSPLKVGTHLYFSQVIINYSESGVYLLGTGAYLVPNTTPIPITGFRGARVPGGSCNLQEDKEAALCFQSGFGVRLNQDWKSRAK